jgi:hypothetical protein
MWSKMLSDYTSKHDESKKTTEVSSRLGCDAASLYCLTFQTLGTTNALMQHHITEDRNPPLCHCAHFKSCKKTCEERNLLCERQCKDDTSGFLDIVPGRNAKCAVL